MENKLHRILHSVTKHKHRKYHQEALVSKHMAGDLLYIPGIHKNSLLSLGTECRNAERNNTHRKNHAWITNQGNRVATESHDYVLVPPHSPPGVFNAGVHRPLPSARTYKMNIVGGSRSRHIGWYLYVPL